MIAYFDTSAVVPLFVDEPTSEAAFELFDRAESILSSTLLYAETRAALAAAHRADRVDVGGLRDAVGGFEAVYAGIDVFLPSVDVVRRAGELAQLHALRGYDAVHLASAEAIADPELVLVASDRALLRAGAAIGLTTAALV